MPETKTTALQPISDPQPGVVYANRDGSTYSRPTPVVLLSTERVHLYMRFGKVRVESASVARRDATRGGRMVVIPNFDQPSDLVDGDVQALLDVYASVGEDVTNLGKHGEPIVKRSLPDTFWVMGRLAARRKYEDTVRPEIVALLSNDPVYDWHAANDVWAAANARREAAEAEHRRVVKETNRQARRAEAWATLRGLTDIVHEPDRGGWTRKDRMVRSLGDDEVVLRTDVLAALLAAAGAPDLGKE